nr:polysaccharide deacetylase family protein [uncultured Agathobaculum sp.]
MKLGFARTAVQAVCAVLALCLAVGLLRQDTAQQVFGAQNEQAIRLPILMYHSILKDEARQGSYVVSPAVLAADLDALRQRGYETVTVSDLIAYVYNGTPLPEKPVMLTFDDGYYNNYCYAYPLLQQRGMRAVLSIIGSQTALYTSEGTENAYWSHLRLERLLEMQDVFEVQNHSWNLHEYGERRGCLRRRGEAEESYESLLREDTAQTQQLIADLGLPAPQCYTYPFGAVSEESERILQDMGFLCTLGCEERVNLITRDAGCLYEMGRFNRAAGESTQSYLSRALGE